MENRFDKFLSHIGVQKGQHILVHSAFRKIRDAFPALSIETLIHMLQQILTPEGSIIMPAFTYCFERSSGDHEIFDREKSPSKVGAVSEIFRMMPDVVRTASATHSFSLWGKISRVIDPDHSPDSPLGKGSVLDWLANHSETFILLVGVDFTAMSFCHYLEAQAPVPWADYSPWDYLNVRKVGVSTNGKQALIEIPGCSRSFINFENYLLQQKMIASVGEKNLKSYFLRVETIYQEGIKYIRTDPENFLCPKTSCRTCDSRHEFYENLLMNRHPSQNQNF